MHRYFLKIPWWIRTFFSAYVWKMPVRDKSIYLTFDDGPHPEITPWVLAVLKKYKAAATFFCIGKNVVQYPLVYAQIVQQGHSVGNHTYSHLNGWKTPVDMYLADAKKAATLIDSSLFRPPYGRIRKKQADRLGQMIEKNNVKIIMWHVLSADFDPAVSPEDCAAIVLKRVEPGSVVVFHDSEKAFRNLKYALPVVLERLKAEGYNFKKLETA